MRAFATQNARFLLQATGAFLYDFFNYFSIGAKA
jgi:hypothetical protein